MNSNDLEKQDLFHKKTDRMRTPNQFQRTVKSSNKKPRAEQTAGERSPSRDLLYSRRGSRPPRDSGVTDGGTEVQHESGTDLKDVKMEGRIGDEGTGSRGGKQEDGERQRRKQKGCCTVDSGCRNDLWTLKHTELTQVPIKITDFIHPLLYEGGTHVSHVTSLRSHVTILRSHVTSLRSHVTSLRSHVTILRSHVTSLRRHVTSLRSHVISLRVMWPA